MMSIMEVIEYYHPECKDMTYLDEDDCKFLIIMDSFDCYLADLDWEVSVTYTPQTYSSKKTKKTLHFIAF